MAHAADPLPPVGSRWTRRLGWASGLLTLAALVFVVLHLGEVEQLWSAIGRLAPGWLLIAAALQLATYACLALVWQATLRRAGCALPLRTLTSLGIAELFTNQAVPSGGLSGMALLLRCLTNRGVPAPVAVTAVYVRLAAHYAAFVLAVLAGLAILAAHHAVSPFVLALVAAFIGLVLGLLLLAIWLRHRSRRPAPPLLLRLPTVAWFVAAIGEAPPTLVRNRALYAEATLLQLATFVLDSATLWVLLLAIGEPLAYTAAFASLVMAELVVAIGPIPLGLGSLEATAVFMLRLFGAPLETALAATLLLRGFISWLPMLPGLWVARRELRHGAPARAPDDDPTVRPTG
jgi:uncharacterized membrane protein YbhN (UPF0104 family)